MLAAVSSIRLTATGIALVGDYSKAVELNRHYSSAYLNRGNIFAGKGDQDLAIADYTHAIELNRGTRQLTTVAAKLSRLGKI